MSISNTTSRVQYTVTSAGATYNVTFRFYENTDLTVVHTSTAGVDTTLVYSVGYSVLGAGEEAGGQITLLDLTITDGTLTITRTAPLDQEVTAPLTPASVEEALDRLAMHTQQLQRQVDRSVRFSDSSATANPLVKADAASMLMGFNSSGEPTLVDPDSFSPDLEAAVAAAQAAQAGAEAAESTATAAAGTASAAAGTASGAASDAQGYASDAQGHASDASGSASDASGYASAASGYASDASGYADAAEASAASITGILVNVKTYGAVGDGVTNDTAAIAAAVAALASGQTLYFPPGVYLTDQVNVSTAKLHFYGSGATIKQRVNTNYLLIYVTADDFTLERLTLDGGGSAFQNSFVGMLKGQEVDRLTILDCAFQNTGDTGVQLSGGSDRLRVDRCVFNACEFNGLYTNTDGLGTSYRTQISNCHFYGFTANSSSGLRIAGTPTYPVVDASVVNCTFTDTADAIQGIDFFGGGIGVRVTGCTFNGGVWGVSFGSATDSVLSNNTVRGVTTYALEFAEASTYGGCVRCVISGNTIDGEDALANGVLVGRGEDNIVSNNIITGGTAAGSSKGIHCTSQSCVITGNRVDHFGNLVYLADADNFTLSGNNLSTPYAGHIAVYASSTVPVTRGVIQGNTISGVSPSNKIIDIYSATGSVSNVDVSGNNTSDGSSGGGYQSIEISGTWANIHVHDNFSDDPDNTAVDLDPEFLVVGAATTQGFNHRTLLLNDSSAFTVTIPDPALVPGQTYTYKKVNGSTYAITLDPANSGTIDGASSYDLQTEDAVVTLKSDGGGYRIIAKS